MNYNFEKAIHDAPGESAGGLGMKGLGVQVTIFTTKTQNARGSNAGMFCDLTRKGLVGRVEWFFTRQMICIMLGKFCDSPFGGDITTSIWELEIYLWIDDPEVVYPYDRGRIKKMRKLMKVSSVVGCHLLGE